MTDRVGQHFGSYQLIKLLGEGGCAKVYLGKHRHLNGYAALKVLDATIHPSDEQKFRAEAQRLVDLRHPNIIHLLDFAIENGTPVLIMDYAQKGSLRQHHADGIQMPLTMAVDFVTQIAAALQYAHDHHVIHRDIKPENILLDKDDRVLLSDFGLSLLNPSSQALSTQDPAGTGRYIAPEQLRGQPCFASDQYALAVMIYEWLCGKSPFQGNIWELGYHHMHSDPPSLRTIRPELPSRLEQIVLRALAKKPQDRFVSVQAFAQAFARASQTSPLPYEEEEASPITAPMPAIAGSLSSLTSSYRAEALSSEKNPITQIPSKGPAKESPKPPLPSTLQDQNRMRLLQRVGSFWIKGVLEQSLHEAALLALGLQEQPDAVANPWQLIIQESERTSSPLPTGTHITEVYDKAHGELLILGEPGAGKTTLLLELARDLLKRSELEQTHPIPVIFNLSSWMRKRQPLAIWLIEELESKYKVPRKIGSDWIKANQILPLLDGLDEVDAAFRTDCMQAINAYHQMHSSVPIVACCRLNEYLLQKHFLTLSHAVTIQPLTTEQVNHYFTQIGEKATGLCMAFQDDPVLQELATTPLMLSILLLVYQGSSLEEIKGCVSTEVQQQQIFATYAQRMLKRRSVKAHYGPQQTIHWLSYLAKQMKQQSQTVFYIERIQPAWLMKTWQRRLYYGLIAGPICGLFVGLQTLGTILSFPLTVLITALITGSFFGWFSEPGTAKQSRKTITRLWMRIRQSIATFLEDRMKIGIAAGLFIAITSALYLFLGDFDNWPLGSRIVGALSSGLPSGMCMGVCVGLTAKLERRIEPVEGAGWSWTAIRKDIIKWLLIGIGLVMGLLAALPFLISSHRTEVANFLAFGTSSVIQLILVVMLVSGVTRGLSKRHLDGQQIVTPNQGIWRSARTGVIMGLITGGIAAVFTGISDFTAYFWLPLYMGTSIKPIGIDREAVNIMSHLLGFYPVLSSKGFWALHALFWGLVNAAIPALAVGLSCGGAAYVQHFVLRLLLWYTQRVPINYPRFLDYAAERILLRKVGGGYIFVHRLLLEYFADVEIRATADANSPPRRK